MQILAEWGVLLGGILGGGRLLAGRVLRLRHLSVLQLWQPIVPQLPGQPDGLPTQYCYSMVMERGPLLVCVQRYCVTWASRKRPGLCCQYKQQPLLPG